MRKTGIKGEEKVKDGLKKVGVKVCFDNSVRRTGFEMLENN